MLLMGTLRLPYEREMEELLGRRIGTNNFVPLNDRGDADARRAVFRLLVDSNHFPHGANENFRTAGDFGGQSERNVELRTGSQVLVNCEVNTACGNVACLSVA
jgi:hypothetical protein